MKTKKLTPLEFLNEMTKNGEVKPVVGYKRFLDFKKTVFYGYDYSNGKFLLGRDRHTNNMNYSSECWIEVEPEYEPYPDDVCPDILGKVIIDKRDNRKYLVVIADEDKETLSHIKTDRVWLNNKTLFDFFTLEDGTTIGRVVE